MKVAINGFGRIGRSVFKIALEKGIDIVAINDVHGPEDAHYLLKYDSVYGRYDKKISHTKNHLIVGNKKILVLQERDPEKLPWKKLGVDVVIESTGVFRDREGASKHLKAGANKVVITSPAKNPDTTIVPGVNHKEITKTKKIISVASCTTNCLTPILKVIDDKFGIKQALMTTTHAYTNNQAVHDQYSEKKRRGRSAANNIIPTTTGAAEAVIEVLPQLKGKLKAKAIRVPIPVGSIIDLTITTNKPSNAEKINETIKKASTTNMKGIIEYSEDEIVSSDIIKNPHSSVFDSLLTESIGNTTKLFSWYDNEYGYSNRVVDVIQIIKKQK